MGPAKVDQLVEMMSNSTVRLPDIIKQCLNIFQILC